MKQIRITEYIKIGASLLLLACIMLPISSCSKTVDEDGNWSAWSKKTPVWTVVEYNYIWDDFDPADSLSWLLVACLLWPIPIVIHRHATKRKRLKQVFWVLEPLLVGGASYCILAVSNALASPAIGAYLAHTAHGFYGIAWISEVVMRIRGRKRRNLTKESS